MPTTPDPRPGPAALLAVRVCPADVGRRVTVRHRLDGSTLTDVVGRLESWADGTLVVVRRDGTPVRVAVDDVVAARVVPPEVGAEELQRVAQRGWVPWETAPLGEWELRASGGITGRANSVRVAGDPGMPLPEALEAVRRWYASRALPPLLQLPVPSVHDALLDASGWSVARSTVLRTGEVAALLAAGTAPPAGVRLERHERPSAELLALVEPGLDPEGVTRILTGAPSVVHVEVRDDADGTLLATGRGSVTPAASGRWLGVTSIATVPAARRRGLARAVMAELGRWGREQAAEHVLLQMLADNAAASRLYDGLGIVPHHAYVYRSPTPGAIGAH